ncbi:cytochrome P450 [Solihabitans fulvus]|uniref:Cytochrome P450 n=1 Tax=Solihabitans fulvus TaxID=1892852 RepID=A0A5B2XTF1_9PSEU|nr:cytochrome P450 [Solihabitans fulvus]KAA2266134.1 cytochrome P450 [Solihabitans fulvus]
MTTVDQQPRTYPFAESERLDIDPRYAELREHEPLARVRLPYGGDAWLATRHEDVRLVLGDPRFSRAATVGRDVPRLTPSLSRDSSILSMDPPEHSRLRRLVAKAFTARRVEQLRPRAQQVVDGLLDDLVAQGSPADLVEGLALPLPITMICELLGVPTEDRDRFRAWSDTVLALTAFSPEEIEVAIAELNGYLAGLIQQRREEPTDDLLGALVLARDEDDRLSEDELVGLGVTLLVAGHETTANQIGNFVYALLTHPGPLAALRADPQALPTAIEELLRFTPLGSSAGFPRIAMEDVEVGGVLVRAGEAVLVHAVSANRDERVFEHAADLDLVRAHNPHIAFGHGVHHCLGAPLARMELQVAVGTLLDRFPRLDFAVPADEVPWKRGRLVRGLRALPVTW